MPNFSTVLQRHYEQTPDKVAITMLFAGQPDRPVTYRDLIQGSSGYVRTYAKNGIQPGDVVLLILQHDMHLLYAYFGAVLLGAIPSIMPFLTEKLLPDRYRSDLAELVPHTQPTAIVTYQEFESEVRAALNPGEDVVKAVIVCDESDGSVDGPCLPDFSSFDGLHRNEEDVALLQHSSGSTGLQKGVALSHRAIFNHLDSYAESILLTQEDVIVSWLPLYHDMGLIACFLLPILLGIPVVQMSPFDWVRAPHRLMQAISTYHGTLTWLPNFAYNFCAQKIRDRDMEGVDLSSWRATINTAEPVKFKSHQMFYERFKSYNLRLETLQTSYGMAENVFAVTQNDLSKLPYVEEVDRESFTTDLVARPAYDGRPVIQMMSCGKPIPNTRVRVVDSKGRDLPERHIGEIVLKSNCMLTGYYRRPDITKKAFLEDGWYKSGDYGYMVNGEVFIAGRKKDLIIVGGKNIYPQDLEQLAYEVPGVHAGRASAFGVFNEATGTEDVVMVAEVDLYDPVEQQKIADGIRATVTRGSAVALRYVHLVRHPWLVKTSSGKTARSANRDKFLKEMLAKGQIY
jgi:acyl-CoA synthetase (AMP-forming)/AMP-acid ligase II